LTFPKRTHSKTPTPLGSLCAGLLASQSRKARDASRAEAEGHGLGQLSGDRGKLS